MNIAEKLAEGQSRATTEAIVGYVGAEPRRFAELFRTFQRGDFRLQQCAAWPISVVAEKHPELVEPFLPKLIEYLPLIDVHDAVKRSILRLLEFVKMPDRLKGKIFSYSIDLLGDPRQAVAIRCFALSAAAKAARGEPPALINEIKLVVNKHRGHATAGFKARVRRVLSER